MNDVIARYQDQLSGVLSGFDQLLLHHKSGMQGSLWAEWDYDVRPGRLGDRVFFLLHDARHLVCTQK